MKLALMLAAFVLCLSAGLGRAEEAATLVPDSGEPAIHYNFPIHRHDCLCGCDEYLRVCPCQIVEDWPCCGLPGERCCPCDESRFPPGRSPDHRPGREGS